MKKKYVIDSEMNGKPYQILWVENRNFVTLFNREEVEKNFIPRLMNLNEFKRKVRDGIIVPKQSLPKGLSPDSFRWKAGEFLYSRVSTFFFKLARKLGKVKRISKLAPAVFKLGDFFFVRGYRLTQMIKN